MKKVMFIGAVALLGLTSCKKDYTCECTLNVGSTSTKAAYPLTDQTKSSATTNCDALKTNYSSYSLLGGSVNCELK